MRLYFLSCRDRDSDFQSCRDRDSDFQSCQDRDSLRHWFFKVVETETHRDSDFSKLSRPRPIETLIFQSCRDRDSSRTKNFEVVETETHRDWAKVVKSRYSLPDTQNTKVVYFSIGVSRSCRICKFPDGKIFRCSFSHSLYFLHSSLPFFSGSSSIFSPCNH